MALMERAKLILLQPKEEWPVIDAERTTAGELYKGYIMPLAAIGPVAGLIGNTLFGIRVPFTTVSYRPPFITSVTSAIVQYVLALLVTYVLALIIDALAPTFSGKKDHLQALKVAAYAGTAAWVAGIFALIPALAILGMLLSLYSLYLLYLGLPVLMKAPQDKAVGYTVVVIVVAIVLYYLIVVIAARFAWQPAGAPIV